MKEEFYEVKEQMKTIIIEIGFFKIGMVEIKKRMTSLEKENHEKMKTKISEMAKRIDELWRNVQEKAKNNVANPTLVLMM